MNYYGSNQQVNNPYGLDLDQNGHPLNTQRNMDILNEIERQRMGAMPQYAHPAPGYGYDRAPTYPRDNYYPEQVVSSRDSDRFMYRENGGTAQTNQQSFYRENVRHDRGYDAYGSSYAPQGGAAVPNRFVEEDRAPAYPRASTDYVDKTPVQEEPMVKRSDRENRIMIPHNGIYHWTLLPKGLKEERIVTTSKILSESKKMEKGKEVKIVNIGDYYASSIIKSEEGVMNHVEDRFSEELFKEHAGDKVEVRKLEVIEIKNDLVNLVNSFSNNHLVNRLLQEISRTPNFDKDKVYTFDYVNATKYYSTKANNLFVDAAIRLNGFHEIAAELPTIFDKYAENESNINSLLTIDAELTRDFLTFIRGFTGNENIKCLSFMNSVGKLYQAAENYIDMTAQRNIKAGIERFTNILFLNIKRFKNEMAEDFAAGITVPRSELSIITKNNKIREELATLSEVNESRFYLVDDGYTPELARMIEDIDSSKIISKYTKTTLYTIDGLYQIVKTKGKGYYIALVDIYKI